MNQTEMLQRLAALSNRINARAREFRERGEFSASHEASMQEILEKRKQLRMKVESAAKRGTWELIKAELISDYETISDNVTLWEQRLDADTMKRQAGSR